MLNDEGEVISKYDGRKCAMFKSLKNHNLKQRFDILIGDQHRQHLMKELHVPSSGVSIGDTHANLGES